MFGMITNELYMTDKQRKALKEFASYWRMMSRAKDYTALKCGYAGADRILNEHFPVDAINWRGLDRHYHSCEDSIRIEQEVRDGQDVRARKMGDADMVTIQVADDITVTVTRERR